MRFEFSKTFFVDLGIRVITLDYFVIREIISNSLTKYYGRSSKGIAVLDLGCGTGRMSGFFSSKKYVGVDIDKPSIEFAKKEYKKFNFIFGDATNFKSAKKNDLVLVVGVMHHLKDGDFKKAVKVISNNLKKNGKVFFIEAIYPIYSWNFIGRFLRNLDQGHDIRTLEDYGRFIKRDLHIIESYKKVGGLVDYGVIIAEK